MKYRKLQIPIYGTHFIIIVGDNREKIEDKFNIDVSPDFFAHTIWGRLGIGKDEVNCIYLAFNSGRTFRPLNHGIVAHEAYHASSMLFEYLGEDQLHHEAQAYLIAYFTDEITKVLTRAGINLDRYK